MTEHARTTRPYGIVIVGGGPMCTYAVERLAALLSSAPAPVTISIFERNGRFGAGMTHNDEQAHTSYMNRAAGQMTFSVDESHAEQLLSATARPTFLEWARTQYIATGDERFKLHAQDVPLRYLHGLALRQQFETYVSLLRATPGVDVTLYAAEVSRVTQRPDGSYDVTADGVPSVIADDVLFVTGHGPCRAPAASVAARLACHGASSDALRYVHYAYPLNERLPDAAIGPDDVVGVMGLGLTAIDVFLHLTEGRGGSFSAAAGGPGRLAYEPSGREPASIVGFCPSGVFPRARPRNAKLGRATVPPSGGFFTVAAIQTLRERCGRPARFGDRVVRQLDFDEHVFPLVVLEMSHAYYRTLLGPRFAEQLRRAAAPAHDWFLHSGAGTMSSPEAITQLLAPVQALFDEAAAVLVGQSAAGVATVDHDEAAEHWHRTLYGAAALPVPSGTWPPSPWGHSTDVRDHRFDWHNIFEPLGDADGTTWQPRLTALVAIDNAYADQGNIDNPFKAACDDVWRDMRAVFSAAVDLGGLTAESHRAFVLTHLRHYNRLSNGAALEAMRKVLALIEAGLLDVSVGPAPAVELRDDGQVFVRGQSTGVSRRLDVIVDGRTHPFDAALDSRPLYPNLLADGLVRQWRNPSQTGGLDYVPGGLDLTTDFHPVDHDGTVQPRLTCLGAPTEGVIFFQASAARPHANNYILNNTAQWAREVVGRVQATRAPGPWAAGLETVG